MKKYDIISLACTAALILCLAIDKFITPVPFVTYVPIAIVFCVANFLSRYKD